MNNSTYIYGLVDPRTLIIRYVGKANQPNIRLRSHLREARTSPRNAAKASWLKELIVQGLEPMIVLLEQVAIAHWQQRERFWIATYRAQLTNLDDGGRGPGNHYAETNRRHSAAAKRNWSNPQYRTKRAIAMKVAKSDAAYLRRQSEASKRVWQMPGYRQRRGSAHVQALTAEIRYQMGKAFRQLNSDPIFQEKRADGMRSFYNNPCAREHFSHIQKIAQNRPEVRAKRSQAARLAHARPDVKQRHSDAIKQSWVQRGGK